MPPTAAVSSRQLPAGFFHSKIRKIRKKSGLFFYIRDLSRLCRFANSVHSCAARWANAFHGWLTIFHRNRCCILHLFFCFTLYAVCFYHFNHLLSMFDLFIISRAHSRSCIHCSEPRSRLSSLFYAFLSCFKDKIQSCRDIFIKLSSKLIKIKQAL